MKGGEVMRAITTTFQEVKLYGTKSVKCRDGCGRTLKRQRKFWQTLNPFNKNAAGEIKSVADIRVELQLELDHWRHEPEVCKHCAK